MADLVLRNACLSDGCNADIAIEAGVIAAIESRIADRGVQEIDAEGRLVLPAFVNGQLHACKSFWRRIVDQLPEEEQQRPRFDVAHLVKRHYTFEDVINRVEEIMQLAIRHGTCAIRLFADVDADAGLTAVEALLEIRRRYTDVMTVQVVAFPQDGFAVASTFELMRQALMLGVDVVGGIPWIEDSASIQMRHTDACFELAQEFGCDLHFVCDDVVDSASRSLAYVADQTIALGWHGRVSATQCAALSAYPEEEAAAVIRRVAEAGISIFCNSHVALIATEFPGGQPWPRGITRVHDLLAAGVPVICAQDDIDNWFYPFGRNDMLEVAQFMAHNGQFAWKDDVQKVLPMVTSTPAAVLGLSNYGLHPGAPANIVVLDSPDWHTAVQFQAEKRYVILRGRLVAETERRTRLDLP